MSVRKILGCIRKADNDFKMIEDGDRIAVGVSGGKDSMLLLYCLNLYKRFADKKFEVVGIHIEMGFPGMDFQPIEAFCATNDIEFIHYPSQIYEILKRNLNKDGSIKCSLCSVFKKSHIIAAAQANNCTKVSFAHHADDAIETLFLNMIYGGKIATFKAKMHMSKTDTNFIRPLVYAHEKDINKAINQANIPVVTSKCPNDGHTQRQAIKDTLDALYHQYPTAKDNFLIMLHNQKQVALWEKDEENE